jgi:hypothetical protein
VIDAHRGGAAVVGVLALVTTVAACSPTTSTSGRAGTTTYPPTSTSAPAGGGTKSGPSTTTTSAAPTTTAPTSGSAAIVVQIFSPSFVLSIQAHVPDLASRAVNGVLTSPTVFDMDLLGIQPTAGADVTSASGQIQEVVVSAAPQGAHVHVLLRAPASHFQVAVGGGSQVEVTFS